VLERQCRQQRKADDDAEGNDHERDDIAARGTLFPKRQQQAERQHAGDSGASDRQKDRVELYHRQARGRERPAKDHNPDESVDPSARHSVHLKPQVIDPYRWWRLAILVTVRYGLGKLLWYRIRYG
jgi:hypothetical protein